ncbi:MAG: bifunctional riboflavin kinase/FAD synthetase [Armatimonadota bacterium]
MHIIKLDSNIKLPQSVIALGFFDGVHLGHREVIDKAVSYAEILGIKSAVFTFKDRPKKNTETKGLILKFEDKVNFIKELGIDNLIWADFDDKISHITSYNFIKDILVSKFNARLVVVGYNYHFGYKAEGSADYLNKTGKKFGFKAEVIPAFKVSGKVVSSTIVKEFITSGRLDKAASFLGRYFFAEGRVIKGKGVGSRLGIHTANLNWPEGLIKPEDGVYAVLVRINDKLYKGVANLGHSPTIKEKPLTLEVHIFNFAKDIYKENIRVYFVEKIRDEKVFSGTEKLTEQIKEDIKKAKIILNA